MVHILITLYYDFIEPILTAKKALEELGFFVSGYPLFKFNASQEEMKIRYEDFINFINVNKPEYILWWNFYIPIDIISKIKVHCPQVRNYMYNWDDPYCWSLPDYDKKIQHFDMAFVSSAEKFDNYLKYLCKPALLYPGFNNKIHYPIINDDDNDVEQYECDISICCTNLYSDKTIYPNQKINRKDLIDAIYFGQKTFNYKFHIYGPPFLSTLYPDSYKRELHYVDTNKLFNYSKINICTHVTQGNKYINERCILILASGGLLYVDNLINFNNYNCNEDNDINENENNNNEKFYVNIDIEDPVKQLVNILKNYQDYSILRCNGYKIIKKYDWNYWASAIAKFLV